MTLAWIAEGHVSVGSHLVKNSFAADSSSENSIQAKGAKPLRGNPLLASRPVDNYFSMLGGHKVLFCLAAGKKIHFAAAQTPKGL